MIASENSGDSPEWIKMLVTVIATVIGAGFGLFIGLLFVSRGFWEGLLVLALTLIGAVAGHLYATSESPWAQHE